MRILRIIWFLVMSVTVILLTLLSVRSWPPRLGVELGGGVRWVYEIDREAMGAGADAGVSPETIDWDSLERALRGRIDPGRSGGCRTRRLSDWQVEIVTAARGEEEIARISNLIGTLGVLEFRVVANSVDHQPIIDSAREQAEDVERCRAAYVVREGQPVGFWARVPWQVEPGAGALGRLSIWVGADLIRDASTGRLIEVPLRFRTADDLAVERYLAEREIDTIEILMALDDGFDVNGNHLAVVSRAWDEMGHPCVDFAMTSRGAALMRGLTGTNLPNRDREFYRRLGIMLDGVVLSAPRVMSTISDRGRITGSFTEQEVDYLLAILTAGTLPVALQSVPVSETSVDPDAAAMGGTVMMLCVAGAIVSALWLILVVRHGISGLAGILASLVHALLTLAAILLVRLAVSQDTVLAALAMTVLAAIGHTVMCEGARPGQASGSGPHPRSWWKFSIVVVAVTFVSCVLLVSGILGYALATGAFRNVSVAILLGSFAALLTGPITLAALLAMVVAERVYGTAVVEEIWNGRRSGARSVPAALENVKSGHSAVVGLSKPSQKKHGPKIRTGGCCGTWTAKNVCCRCRDVVRSGTIGWAAVVQLRTGGRRT